MKNLEKLSTKLEVDWTKLGDMLKMVSISYPDVKQPEELAKLVSDNFNVICTEADIKGYNSAISEMETAIRHQIEDYELENRKTLYGYGGIY